MGAFLEVISDPVQWIGYVGMLFAMLSYQFRKNRTYFLLQAACGVAFSVQFVLLHSWAAMLMNVFSILRGLIMAGGARFKRIPYLVLMEALFFGSCAASFLFFGEEWWIALLLAVAQCGGTLVMWGRDGKKIRLAQLLMISPLWLTNNIYYGSIGGIVCEVFNICSVLVSFIRFRRTGYDKT